MPAQKQHASAVDHKSRSSGCKNPLQKHQESNPLWSHLATGPDIQTKLAIGASGDKYEQEADAVADQVMRMSAESDFNGRQEESPVIQPKTNAAASQLSNIDLVRHAISSPGSGAPLNEAVRSRVEPVLGTELLKVKVHNGIPAQEASRSINARAFTHRNHIFIGRGESVTDLRLMAHESAHVAQQAGRGGQIQRSPLGVHVPDIDKPEEVSEIETQYDYQWQNSVLLETIYDDKETEGNERLNSLRQFLYIQRELELRGMFEGVDGGLTVKDIKLIAAREKGELEATRSQEEQVVVDKKDQIKTNNSNLKALSGELKTARSERRSRLKRGSRAAEIASTRTKVLEKIKFEQGQLEKAESNLAWTEKKKRSFGVEKYNEKVKLWGGRKQRALDRISSQQKIIADTQGEYDLLISPYDVVIESIMQQQNALTLANQQLAAEVKDAKNNIKSINSDIASISKVDNGKHDSIMEWKLRRYTRELKEMEHQTLLEEIQTLFDRDDGSRFPPWVRYAVIHMSGMRYAGAHNSWYSPRKLLTLLKEVEVQEAGYSDRMAMMGMGEEWLASHPDMSGLKLSKHQKKILRATEQQKIEKQLSGEDIPLYNRFTQREFELYALYRSLRQVDTSSPATQQLLNHISQIEQEISAIEGEMSEDGRKTVIKNRAKRQKVLLIIYQKRAISKINLLNDRQALTILQQMKASGEIPEAVWREITVFTHLRIDTQDPEWETIKKSRGLKGVVGETDEEKARLDAWRGILSKKKFYKNLTGWRAHHAETLSPSITASIVCDQLGSYMQHMRGHNRKGGLRNNAMYYLSQVQAGRGEDPIMEQFMGALLSRKRSAPYFRAPTSHHDFLPGASLYWMKWSPLAYEDEYEKLAKSYSHAESKLSRLRGKQAKDQGKYDRKKIKNDKEVPHYSTSYRNKLAGDIAERKGNIQQVREQLATMKRDMEGMRAFKPEATKVPDISNIVSPTGQLGNVYTIGKMSFVDGYVDNEGWTYRIQKQVINGREVTSIMRAKLNPYDCALGGCELEFSVNSNPNVVKQWFKFTHEATVMHADEKWTITFNTSTKFDNEKVKAMGANKNSTKNLLNDSGLMVGYAPAAEATADISPYLSGYMSRMDEEARHANDNEDK